MGKKKRKTPMGCEAKKIIIPKQLRKTEFRFNKLKDKDKTPIENDWQNSANYKFDDIKLIGWGGNLGIIGGYGNLVIIDADSLEIAKNAEELPPTFTVKTGSPEEYKKHYFFICNKELKPIRLSKEKQGDLGDIRSTGQYVVAPNSTHPSGNKYRVIKDLPITKIKESELRNAFSDYIDKTSPIIKREYLPDTTKRDTPYIRNCKALDFFLNNKVKSETSKNWKLFRYLVDIAYNRSLSQQVLENICKMQGHSIGAIKGWGKLATEGKMEKSSCRKMRKYLKFYHPNLINKICFGCPLQKELGKPFKQLKENVCSKLLMKKTREATELITNYILEKEHIRTTRDDEKSEVWIYKKGIYVPEGKTYIKETSRKILGEGYTNHMANEVVAKIEAETYIEQDKFFTVENINHIAVKNGILDLMTKKLMSFTPKEKHFNKLPIEYKEGVGCPNILKHFEEVLQSKEDTPVLQELFGYLLYREYKVEKAFMFTGCGRNGKGKTLELMKRFIGIDNCSNITLQHIESDTFAMGELFNKLANLGGDISKAALKETGNFKSLTGRDLLSAARKFKTRVNFVNYAKMIFCANELPITYDITTAFFNRWVLLEFPYTFLSQKEIDCLDGKDNNIKLADPGIVDKMASDEELSGLLNWALGGLKRVLEQGDFSYSPSTEDVKNKWIRKSDSTAAFLMDEIEEDMNGYVSKFKLRQKYSLYCKKHNLKASGDKMLKNTLVINFGVTDSKKSLDGEQVHCWEGIKFKVEEEEVI